MKNRKYIYAAALMACVLASASLTACSSATVPSRITVQSTENSGITVSGEEKVKARIKDIIFNSKVYIENENCPYGMER